MNARSLALPVALVLLAAARAGAGELPVNVFAVAPGDEEQTLLFLGTARPALIRLRIQVDGQGYRARWENVVRGMAQYFDTDGDGALSRREIALIDLARLGAGGLRPAMPAARRATGASDRSDPADLAEKVRVFAPAFSIQAVASPEAQGVDAFAALDRDKDGRLGRDEVAEAQSMLERLDIDDDETISARELAPYRNPFYANAVVNRTDPISDGPSTGRADLVADASPAARARAILGRYDSGAARAGSAPPGVPLGTLILQALASPRPRTRDDRLDRDEIGLDPAAFDRADADGDGGLDLREIERGPATVPDIELIVRLGRRDPGRAAVEVVGPPGPRPGGITLRRLGDDGVVIELGTSVIELRADEDSGSQPLASRKALYLNQFRSVDANKDGILGRDEGRGAPVLSRFFDVADRDRDGRLAEAELIAYFDFQAEVAGLRTVLRAIDQGGTLLDLLDVDRDRRIGLRELHAMPEIMRREDRDGDGYVAAREIARHYRWSVGQGEGGAILGLPAAVPARFATPSFPAPPSAPTWFLKMDRNRDGDLSPREFLGPGSAFAAYDADGDGLISPAEARRSPRAGARQ